MENSKKKYEAPKAEEVQMVSTELLASMQTALQTATETINKVKEEATSANDKYLRALADYQNLKRISDIKIANSKDAGKITVIKSLLTSIDNFEKAIESGEVTEGVQLVYNSLISSLKNNGVEFIEPKEGELFNDSIHEAVAPIPGDENNKNTVAFTQMRGYKLGENIIRFAKVGVYV